MDRDELKYLRECRNRNYESLVGDVLPFWMKFGLDRENGGVYTCLDRDGTLMDSTKSVWFQGRFAYVAALAYEKLHDPQFLEASRSCVEFIEEHCFDTDGRMFFSVTAEGKPLRRRRYIFSECFAIIAMAEYAKASGEMSYAKKAHELLLRTMKVLSTPGAITPKYLFEARGHSETMMFINVINVLKEVVDDPSLDREIDSSIQALGKYFMNHEYRTILETVGPDGEFLDTLMGRTINPGHCMETGWFILQIAKQRGWDPALVKMGTTIIDWAWDWGWDEPYGGMINFRDCKGFPNQDYSQDMKFWWPQCETILAGLYAYEATGEAKYLEMHRKAYEFAFKHFPDPEYGEWYGYLHRDGTPAHRAKGNLFKGPFHVPRMLLLSCDLYDEILSAGK